jgi:sugar lactone lactonase YvrE
MTKTTTVLLACLVACGKSDEPPAPKTKQAAPSPAPKTVEATSGEAAAPEPAEQPNLVQPSAAAAGAAYLGVSGTGLVRVAGGKTKTLIEHRFPINDIAIDSRGVVYAAAIGGAWSISGDKVTTLPEIGSSTYFNHLAVAPNGDLWALDHKTAYRWDRKAWMAVPKETFEGQLMSGIAVDRAGRVWVATSDHLWRFDGGTWSKLDRKFTGTTEPYFRAIVAGPNGEVYASCIKGVFAYKDDAWNKVSIAGRDSYLSIDELAVGADGRIVASGDVLDVAIRTPDGELRRVALKKNGAKVRQADVMDVDGAHRVWLRTDNGVVILDGDGKLVQHWTPGTVPGVTGKIETIAVAGNGPTLPELTAAARGTVTGKVVSKGKPVAGATIEICTSPAQLVMFEKTPCTGSAVSFTGVTGADGSFKIADVPVGSYGFAVKPKRTWFVSSGGLEECCTTMENGQVYDIGSINLEKLD